ncbi:MAG: hydantoinase B/oxoprolinase family protein, partial [Alphaproteobacteria bacterium]|nr:hydantoinase B/oxoprolinase family protein [Alphaproteobacteria bacterium]
LASDLRAGRVRGLRACAIVFVHGYRAPAHEKRAAEIARAAGFAQVSTSHETVPLVKYVSRGDTTVADAYLSPVLSHYVRQVSAALACGAEPVRLFFMTSGGGLAAPGHFSGKDAILSGPAGGVVGMAESGRDEGYSRVIGFDMGGTSTDVARFDGSYERIYETRIGGVVLRNSMLAVHTVAAGGGSILHVKDGRFRAGPDSAGATPGPACYRGGGPLTLTDANVLVGKLSAAWFPRIFGRNGDAPLDEEIVSRKFAALARRCENSPERVAEGFIRVAVENMANAIRRISVAKGYDAREYVLNCFGGAAGQHGCLVADALGISTVLVHPLSGALSAYGIKLAQLKILRQQNVGAELSDAVVLDIRRAAQFLQREAEQSLRQQGAAKPSADIRVHLRYLGSDTAIPVPLSDRDSMASQFGQMHSRLFGFGFAGVPVIAESLEVEARGAADIREASMDRAEASGAPAGHARFFSQGHWHAAAIFRCEDIRSGQRIDGPAVLIDPNQTVVVEPGWRAEMRSSRSLILKHASKEAGYGAQKGAHGPARMNIESDPVSLEVFANLFMAIAEEMGVVLQNTSSSVNIKERLDFSCAVFDADGDLIANAPHMPVHLGSMGDCVKSITTRHPRMREGDAFAINAPYSGGTHLPDITVVAPVFIEGTRRFFVATRGHHADVGGISPGSMPAFSNSIEEEGVVLDGLRIVDAGILMEDKLRSALMSGPWPARNPDQNIADLKAQLAACARGQAELARACSLHGADVISAYMAHVQDNAERSVRRVIGALSDGDFEVPLDSGEMIRVAVTVNREARSARVDFTGTSPQSQGNFNAPGSVTKAAVLYVFRCLVDTDIPMNAGCLRPIEIVIPEGSLLSPRHPAAVAAGNVETSQAIVDALFGALGVMAASQGTMNNLTFGNARVQYYETICGGAGAGKDFDGASAVHTHMTNSRLTDPEVLESRLPVRVEEFRIRRGSGGAGRHRGGDGTVRRLRFLEDVSLSLLSSRRNTAPFGLAGGEPGARGTASILRKTGETLRMKGCDAVEVQSGDMIEIETPGGGGFGRMGR